MNRRLFVKKVLNGTIAGSLYLVWPMKSGSLEISEQIPEQIRGIKNREYDIHHQEFAFIVDITRCIGCGSCCVADKREYNVPDGNYRTWVERYVKGFSDKIYVDSPNGGLDGYQHHRTDIDEKVRDTFFVPKLCNMCKEAPCVQVCPVGATFKSPDGFVLVDEKRCVGCAYCIQACPYSVRFIHPIKKTVEKCTWCYQRVRKGLLPACVDVCPTGARKFGSMKDETSEVYNILKGPGVLTVLRKEMGTFPALYYKGARREVI
ncbi:4Fe-4S dicluster domain-containing protein [Desulfobacula sp.]|jgi:tetrathionate reductase subunit B|uniref:4Fe-4S dicluster domain-containing protein n=2 Tax=Desulfobacula sp. TaxID=2593537 RepID=UPI0039B915A0|nr:4Fe-4S dicluster domain-containing protein [Desulfobacula sp.]